MFSLILRKNDEKCFFRIIRGGANYRVKWQSHFSILRAPGALNTENTVRKKTRLAEGLIDNEFVRSPFKTGWKHQFTCAYVFVCIHWVFSKCFLLLC